MKDSTAKKESPDRVKAPAPIQSAEAGDKTPEYVEWYKQNHTAEEFNAKYGSRKI